MSHSADYDAPLFETMEDSAIPSPYTTLWAIKHPDPANAKVGDEVTITPVTLDPVTRDAETDALDFIRRLIGAWDCCGTCAGGVLAQHDREVRAEAWGEGFAADRDVVYGVPESTNPYVTPPDKTAIARVGTAEVSGPPELAGQLRPTGRGRPAE